MLDTRDLMSYSGANFRGRGIEVKRPSGHRRNRQRELCCPRCGGFMTPERFSDIIDETGQLHFAGWRCLACGEVLDPVILANRRLPNRTSTPAGKQRV